MAERPVAVNMPPCSSDTSTTAGAPSQEYKNGNGLASASVSASAAESEPSTWHLQHKMVHEAEVDLDSDNNMCARQQLPRQ